MEYSIGTKYKTSGRTRTNICTVTDIYKTYNSAGDLVKVRYEAQHEFCGQVVNDHGVCATTIARGLIGE
jgi:hypothetical protein